MGTPVRILEREMQCVGSGKCESRPMTEEEMLKYYTKEEIERMKGIKIEPPEKEILTATLAECEGKTKAIYYAAKKFKVSSQTIYNWIKQYGIEFDANGRVNQDTEGVMPSQEEAKIGKMTDAEFNSYLDEILNEANNNPDTITITGQESKEITKRLGYAEHDIGNATLQIDFRQELVKIISPSDNEMTFEEAIAAAEMILDVLGHE